MFLRFHQNPLCLAGDVLWSFLSILGVRKRVVSKRVVFGGCSPVPKTGTMIQSDVPQYQKTGTRVHSDVLCTKNRNEGTFAKTALLRNRPFVKTFISCYRTPGAWNWSLVPGSLAHHRFRYLLESFSNGSWRRFQGVSKGPSAETLQKPFRDPFRDPLGPI